MKRSQVVKAFKDYAKKYAHPDDLPSDNPEVVVAYQLLNRWFSEEMVLASSSPKSETVAWVEFFRTVIFVDAGFDDVDYLDEIANEQLLQDFQNALSSGYYLLAITIRVKIFWIRLRMSLK